MEIKSGESPLNTPIRTPPLRFAVNLQSRIYHDQMAVHKAEQRSSNSKLRTCRLEQKGVSALLSSEARARGARRSKHHLKHLNTRLKSMQRAAILRNTQRCERQMQLNLKVVTHARGETPLGIGVVAGLLHGEATRPRRSST